MKQGGDYADYSYCHVVGQTDVGRRRKANEDTGGHYVTINGLVSVVCDGMGGHVGGAIASQTAVEAIHEFLECRYYDDPREAVGLAIQAANESILKKTQIQPELTGMGATCVLLLVRDGKVYIGHVGDSRIYLIREKTIIQLTKDHSFVQTLVDMGHITKEEAEHHPRKNEITNALGFPDMLPATVRSEAIEPQSGDCFLLCSDGLSGMVTDQSIEKIVSKQRELTSQQRADLLVQTANNNGGVDNITVELVEFVLTPSADGIGKKRKIPTALFVVLTIFVLAGAGVGSFLLLKRPSVEKKGVLLPDVEVRYKESEVLFRLESGKEDYVFEVVKGDVRHIIKNVEIDAISTNLIQSESGNGLEFKVPEMIKADSFYIQIPSKDTLYRYSIWVKVSNAEFFMNEMVFKKKEEIARIDTAESNRYVLKLSGHNKVEIIEADSFSVEPKVGLFVSRQNGATTIKFDRNFSGEEVRITFSGEGADIVYVIPVVKEAPSGGASSQSNNRPINRALDSLSIRPESIREVIAVTLKLSEYAGKTMIISTNFVDVDGNKTEFSPVSSLTSDYTLDKMLEEKIFQKGYDDGKSITLVFGDSIAIGDYSITVPCKRSGVDVDLKITLQIK